MWTHYCGLFSSAKISGDNLSILRDERRALFREAVALPACERYVPIDFWAHARDRDDPFAVFAGEAKGAVCLAVFNWHEEPREFRLSGLAAERWRACEKISGPGEVQVRDVVLTVRLPRHSSAVLAMGRGVRFDDVRRALGVEARVVSIAP